MSQTTDTLNPDRKGSKSGAFRLRKFLTVRPFGPVIILLVFTLLAVLYDLNVPFFEKPDELKHFAVIQHFQTYDRLPIVRAGIYKPWDQEGTQPPLYHILAAWLSGWLDISEFEEPPRNPHYVDDRSFVWRERENNNLYLHTPGEAWSTEPVFLAARLARWLSLLAGVGTVSFTYLLAYLMFGVCKTGPDSPARLPHPLICAIQNSIPLVAAALVAFVPQFLHVNSAITNDSLSATLAAGALVMLILIVKRGITFRYTIILGVLLGLGALTKLSLLYLLPLTALVFVWHAARSRTFVLLLSHGGLLAVLVSLISGWWYWRNWQIYGDPTALTAHLLYRGGALDPRPSLAQIWQTEIVGLELSFWAAFGAGQILIEPWLYRILGWIKYIALTGILLGLWFRLGTSQKSPRHKRQTTNDGLPDEFGFHRFTPDQMISLALLALWVFIIFAALLRWMQITPASWGRLLYPALPAAAVLTAWGFSEISRLMLYAASYVSHSRWRAILGGMALAWLWLPALGLFILALVSPFRYLQPAYAKTPLIAGTELPNDMTMLDYFYGAERLRLIGYRLEQPAVQPGEWLPVRLYWQATQPIGKNYSSFVHLLNRSGQAVAQTNTYPDGGKWPTSMLVPGQVLADTYHIWIPPDTPAPLAVRLAMGIFEFDDPLRAAKPAVNNLGQPVEPIVEGVALVPDTWPSFSPAHPLAANFGDKIRLIGFDWANQKTKPGAVLPITFYWETLASPGQNLVLFIHLIDPVTQSQVAGFDGPPDYPTAYWQTGSTILDARTLLLPAALPAGEYELYIGWYNFSDNSRLPLVGNNSGDALRLVQIIVE